MKRWDSSHASDWFVEFTAPFCKAAGIWVGDELALSLWPANVETPAELDALLRHPPSLTRTTRTVSGWGAKTQVLPVRRQ